MDLLGHSAAGDLATLYAAAFPQRVAHLILLTTGRDAVGVEETDEQWRAALARRSAEPCYRAALAAMEKAEAGDESMDNRRLHAVLLRPLGQCGPGPRRCRGQRALSPCTGRLPRRGRGRHAADWSPLSSDVSSRGGPAGPRASRARPQPGRCERVAGTAAGGSAGGSCSPM